MNTKASGRALLFVILLCVILAAAFDDTIGSPRANVLLIVIDTLRADHLGCYGYERATSPNIDGFSKTGVLFQNAYCQMPTTGPSHASIFTSRYPKSHGVLKNGWVLHDTYSTLAEILKKNGYVTGAVVSSFVLSAKFGYSRGFDSYDEEFPRGQGSLGGGNWEGHSMPGAFDQRADVATQKAVRWIRQHKKETFFLWVHYFDPHDPYEPPEPYLEEFVEENMSPSEKLIASYDGEIRFVDDELGKLLDTMRKEGLDSNTLTIIMSDHGEGLGQHGWMKHGFFLYDEQAKIPLTMSFPGVIPKGVNLNSVVQTIDILPTTLDLLGLRHHENFSGRSLVDMIRKPEDSYGHTAYLERRRYIDGKRGDFRVEGDKFAVRRDDMKYIWAPQEETEELYDLTKDRGELSNIIDQHPEIAAEMRKLILEWKEERDADIEEFKQTLDPVSRAKLRALGYID